MDTTIKHYFYILIFHFVLSCSYVIAQDYESYTYRLTQSNTQYLLWTTLPSERVFKDQAILENTGSLVKVYAAKNEFEPFQIVVNPSVSGEISIKADQFENDISLVDNDISLEIFQVKYVPITQATDSLGQTGDYPDPLWPIENNSSLYCKQGENTAFWFNVFVPKETLAGDYETTIYIADIAIPVKLHVFDFNVPDELHVKSQMNFSHNTILDKYGVSGTGEDYWLYVFKIKQYFIDHRLTPKSVLWSGGVTSSGGKPYIDYDCNGNFSDNDGIWGFEIPADVFLNGNGFNDGTGFPSFMAATFQNNDSSKDQRPSLFCDQSLSTDDWLTSSDTSYNIKWFNYVKALQDYLDQLGYLEKAYYYFANEPQDQEDYDAVAWYSQELKKAAPNLKLMISEEPKPEIYNHPVYTGAKIDIWLPVLNQYDPEVSYEREIQHNEETWIYFLHGTRPPYFNPITLDHPGIESKFTGWFLWKYRIKGIAYYSLNNWSQNPWTNPLNSNHNGDLFMLYPPSETNESIEFASNNHRFVPSIRFELMRDSLEDYEYLYLLNNQNQPKPDTTNISDTQVDKIISGITAYTRDSEFMYNLRRVIGLKIGGEISDIPEIEPIASHPRAEQEPGNYYINFQDPESEPLDSPLIVDNKEYMKIGWNEYDEDLGYGWYGDMDHVMSRYLSNGPNKLQSSILYDDWGREHTFEFDLPNSVYNVTLSVGWADRQYQHNKVTIEDIVFVDDEATDPYIVRTKQVSVTDNKLTLLMGIFDEYTMLNYMDIEAVNQNDPVLSVSLSGIQVKLSWTTIADADSYLLLYAPYDLSYIGEVDMGSNTNITFDLWQDAMFYVAIKAYNQEEEIFSNVELITIND